MQVLKYLNVEYSSLHINIFKPCQKKYFWKSSSFLVPYSFLYILCIGCDVPLVADIHFSPSVAMRVADAFEKVRINPGNFADGIKSFENKVYNTRVMAPTLNILKLSSRNTCIELSIGWLCLYWMMCRLFSNLLGGVRSGRGGNRKTVRSSGTEVQGEEPSSPNRHKSRISIRQSDVFLGRFAAGTGWVRGWVRQTLQEIWLPQLPFLNEGF